MKRRKFKTFNFKIKRKDDEMNKLVFVLKSVNSILFQQNIKKKVEVNINNYQSVNIPFVSFVRKNHLKYNIIIIFLFKNLHFQTFKTSVSRFYSSNTVFDWIKEHSFIGTLRI
jgi:hypothetical protein